MNDNNIIQSNGCKQLLHRDSNIELYRIVTMILIVAHHYVVNSGLTSLNGPLSACPTSFHSLLLLIIGAFGKTGINCFVFITGYFMCKSNIKLKKFIKLLAEIMFYKIVIGFIFFATGYEPINIKSIIKTILPVTSVGDNFTGCYLLFYLFIPFLNIAIHALSEKQHLRLLILCGFTYVFFGTVKILPVTMNYVSWFMVIYLLASYVRMYPKKIYTATKLWKMLTIVCVALMLMSVIVCAFISKIVKGHMWYAFVADSNTFLAVATGLTSFIYFKNLNIKYNRIINAIAATTFGVLLIHANSDAMRNWLWVDVFKVVEVYDKTLMPLIAVGSIILVFITCSLLDLIRIKFSEKPFLNWFSKREKCMEEKWTNIEHKLLCKMSVSDK